MPKKRKGGLKTLSDHLRSRRSPLLELPPELREQIWMHTVTEWERERSFELHIAFYLRRHPIRQDYLNRPLPPAITRTNRQTRAETLHLYYKLNIFEFWRPPCTPERLPNSTFGRYLTALGPKMPWLREVVLLYKHANELESDIEQALYEQGFELWGCTLRTQLQLTEFEMQYEELGLPRSFGRKRR